MVASAAIVSTSLGLLVPQAAIVSTSLKVSVSAGKAAIVSTSMSVAATGSRAAILSTSMKVLGTFTAQGMPDFTVNPGDEFVLTADYSTTPDSVVWAQQSGPTVALTNFSNEGRAASPYTLTGTVLRFSVTARYGTSTAVSDVEVAVRRHLRWKPGPGNTLVPLHRLTASAGGSLSFGGGPYGSGSFGGGG